MSKQRQPKFLSVIAPAYCEEAGLPSFLERVQATLQELAVPYEIVVVDDGSTDQTWEVIQAAAAKNPQIRGVSLSRNYGHQVAILAGLDQAQGDVMITMDADLQHPPEHFRAMLGAWREGYDIVNMVRQKTEASGFFKDRLSAAFYWIFNRVSRVKISPNGSDFRLIDRAVREAICQYRQRQFFLRGIIAELGFRQKSLDYVAPLRRHGQPSFTLAKSIDLALRGFFTYSNTGLKAPLYFGFLLLAGAISNIGYAFYKLAHGIVLPQGWLSLFTLITILFAFTSIFVGIQGLYLTRILEEVRPQPLYTLKQRTHSASGN